MWTLVSRALRCVPTVPTLSKLDQAEIKHQPQRLERLHQLVVDHLVEYARFKGKALGTTVTNLQQVLRQYEYGIEGVVGFFTQHM